MRLISPVMATSRRAGRPVQEGNEGDGDGHPGGRSFFGGSAGGQMDMDIALAEKSGSMPSSSAWLRT